MTGIHGVRSCIFYRGGEIEFIVLRGHLKLDLDWRPLGMANSVAGMAHRIGGDGFVGNV